MVYLLLQTVPPGNWHNRHYNNEVIEYKAEIRVNVFRHENGNWKCLTELTHINLALETSKEPKTSILSGP